MSNTDNQGSIKYAMAGFLALSVAPSAELDEKKSYA